MTPGVGRPQVQVQRAAVASIVCGGHRGRGRGHGHGRAHDLDLYLCHDAGPLSIDSNRGVLAAAPTCS